MLPALRCQAEGAKMRLARTRMIVVLGVSVYVQVVWVRRYRVRLGEGVSQLLDGAPEVLWGAVLIVQPGWRVHYWFTPSVHGQSHGGASDEPRGSSEQEVPSRG